MGLKKYIEDVSQLADQACEVTGLPKRLAACIIVYADFRTLFVRVRRRTGK